MSKLHAFIQKRKEMERYMSNITSEKLLCLTVTSAKDEAELLAKDWPNYLNVMIVRLYNYDT